MFFVLTFSIFSQGIMKLATDCYEPFYGPELKNNGVITELALEALKSEGIDLNIEFVPWQRAYVMAKEGKYHGLLGALYTDERSRHFLYSKKIFDISIGLFAKRRKGISYDKLDELKKYKIGIVRGYNYSEEFDQADYLNKIESSTSEKSLNLFINDRIDILAGPKKVIECYLDKNFPEEKDEIVYIGELDVRPLYILVSKKVEEGEYFINKLDVGFENIKNSGIYDKIMKKHEIF